ncbi:uncharacterized protein LOC113345345 [Papaver somniferum]|uniref:uncharacterized protein LOC113345345 n=1 Tax=Papaver somniferum TaxID=3469 RepID=UPI000E70302E|nr:uncharacterized protein LOC113345345 [Papaver somniferum]
MNSEGNWDMNIIRNYIDISFHDAINYVTTNISMHDRIRWKSTISGNLNTKFVYNFLTKLNFDKDEAKFWKQIWNLNILPKVNMFCWKVVSYALALRNNMSKYVKDSEPYCMLCDNQDLEDEMHLFFHCNFAKKVWDAFELNNIYHCNGNLDIMHWFKVWMNNKNLTSKHNLISFIIWSIWKFRNSVHFENNVPDVQKLIDIIRDSYQKVNMNGETKTNQVPDKAKMLCRDNHFHGSNAYDWFIHFDAYFIEVDYTMGYAISILDNARVRKQCRAGCSWASFPLEAEAKDGIEAIRWMKELKLQNCYIINDCQTLMKIMKGEVDPEVQPWRSQTSIYRCKFSLLNCNSVSFMYKTRKYVDFEDKLVKDARSRRINYFSTENLSENVRNNILERAKLGLAPILYILQTSSYV